VDESVVSDLLDPRPGLGLVGQLAVDQQMCDVEETALLGEFFDRIPAVAEDAPLTIDERDRRPATGRVQERRIVREQPAIAVGHLDLSQVSGVDRTVPDRNHVAPAGPLVGHLQRRIASHRTAPTS